MNTVGGGDFADSTSTSDSSLERTDAPAPGADKQPAICVHRAFEAQVARTPNAIAVAHGTQVLSYAELGRHANRLAHHLLRLGVKPNDRVAICAERSVGFVVGMLATLKAGAAYVPLDPNQPAARLAYQLDDCAAAMLLTQGSGRDATAQIAGYGTRLDLQHDAEQWSSSPDHVLKHDASLDGESLAYVMYTSGSTGVPKGVEIPHRAIARVVVRNGYADFNATDRVAFAANPAFDASTLELWAPLLNGGTLVVIDQAVLLDPQRLAQVLIEQAVTVMWFTVGLFNQYAVQLKQVLPQLRYLLVGGDVLDPGVIGWVMRECPPQHVINGYGPTETTTFATTYEITADPEGKPIPIGRPIAQTQIYILDAQRQRVANGLEGEIYIGGAGLAHGYLNRPGLTEERFLTNPFVQGERIYKTGDLGRWLPDGAIEYRGRNDFQVKIRGFRIELGEIEARLSEHATVHEAVVLAREDVPGEKQLVAYFTRAANTAPADIEALRAHLASALPAYMVPAAYVVVETFPLTLNGKLDRNALPPPDADAYVSRAYEAPVGATEQALAQIWSEVLKLERVGRQDQFFELGGHSLLAVRMLARIRNVLQRELQAKDIFAHPELAALAELIARSPHSDQVSIVPVSRDRPMPLSFAQQRLWFLAQMEGGSAAYHIPMALRLSGQLDRDALQCALHRIVARHEALRTRFHGAEAALSQRIAANDVGFVLQQHDLRDRSDIELAQAQYLDKEAAQPFNLQHGPLIRGCLLQLGDTEHVLAITMHHIVSDGWSMAVFAEELSALYRAYANGEDDPLPPLAVQYADYALWQRESLSGALLQRESTYWQHALAGAPALLALPTDRPRPAQQSYSGDRVPLTLDATLTRQLKVLGQRHGVTLYMMVLAAWSVVLSRLSGQDDVVIGTPNAHRMQAEIEPLIGFFVNTQAMRVEVTGTVAQLLSGVRERALGAQAHQELPFEQVVELINPPRSLAHTPIFQVMLAWQNNDTRQWELPGLNVALLSGGERVAKFDLVLEINELEQDLVGALNYATALFDRETITRHVGYLLRTLEAMVADDNGSIQQIEILGDTERQQLLHIGSAVQTDYSHETPVHQVFEAQALHTPDAIAVVHGARALTYAELDRHANRLAHHLLRLGVKPNDRVAICAERSVALVIGMLATLKIGAAYVPLDPNQPTERLAYLLDDCAATMLLTQGSGRDATTRIDGYTSRIDLQDDAERWASYPDHAPTVDTLLDGNALAYVMYTSGSTGVPKGVEIPHRAIARVVVRNGYADFNATDRVAFAANPAFDASTLELWAPLLNGGTLVVIDQAVLLDPQRLTQVLIEQAVTVMWFTVGLFNQYAVQLKQVLPQLRYLLVGGDVLDPGVIGWVMRECPPQHLINGYGPTETTTFATTYEITADPEGKPIPIGRPIAQTQIYMLDAQRKLVPTGVEGEIYIGGAGVARGYLNLPELTEERFLPHPFVQGERIYKTGDLGRWLPDGTIEYRGRNDFQVKIRGFRIELGEIEARLAGHPAVHDVVVLAREDAAPGEKQLVAYLTWAATTAPTDIEALRSYLAAVLPAYMVPAAYVVLDALPLTSNGKLDRNALPAPAAEAHVSRAYEAPMGELEENLAQIWSDVLKLERVGRHDNFFELGGHSLLAVMMIARVRNVLQREVQAKDVFAHPVLSALAAMLQQSARSEQSSIVPVSREQLLPLSFAQQRLWFLAQMEGGSEAYHIPLALRLRGQLDRRALQRALDRIVARHEALRTCFVSDGEQTVQRIASAERGFALHDVDLSADTAAQPQLLQQSLTDEARAPFDLQSGPLIRGCLIQLSGTEHVLAITMHHIVSDGWSMGLFVNELSALYRAYVAGEGDPLPPLAVQYADYAVWQRQQLAGYALQPQSAYWQRTLAGAPALLELPTDRPRPAQQSYVGGAVPVMLDAALTRQLNALGQRHGATLYMLVLAAWSVVLSRLSGQDDIVIGTPTANRAHTEVESLIGFFVNTQALRIGMSGTLAELLTQVKRHALDAQAHQDLPFEQVVERINPPRSLSHTPIFQVMLAWQNNAAGMVDLGELQCSPLEVIDGIVKFDLELYLSESNDRIGGELRYVSALFERTTIERQVQYLRRVLEAMVSDPAQAIERIDLLEPAERQQVLFDWNATQVDYPQNVCLHELFETQVARSPDAIALVYEAETLTYAVVNQRANRLARHLLACGVKPDERVALCLERGIDMVVAILATVKAGGAYVPLDPDYPVDRLQHMLADSDPLVVLVDDAGQKSLALCEADAATARVALHLHNDAQAWREQSAGNIERSSVALQPHHLAYVIYTSGSTGKPKGVMNEHAGVVNRLLWMQQAYGLQVHDAVLQKTPYSFDVSVWEFFWPLMVGARLVMARPQGHKDPAYLGQLIRAAGITTLHFVPSMLQLFLTHPAAVQASSGLARVMCSGEALPAALVRQFHEQLSRTALHNLYGPTEAAIDVSAWTCVAGDARSIVPIGTPIANTQLYVLDFEMKPVPVGVAGELYIGGVQVARGYLNLPALTAERFVRDPFGATPGGRLYKTGDLARWLSDGALEYLGRNDFQVKIRGFRIELGEIEARLAEHPAVREAVVLAREDRAGDKRLVAYITADASTVPSVDGLRAHLAAVLPDYMVPPAYVALDELPLSLNGKLDRKALPAPATDAYVNRDYHPPLGELEQALAQIWADVLKIERVGRQDNFFELGGHSLLAATLMARLRQALDVDVSLRQLFVHPALADFAEVVRDAERSAQPPLLPVPRTQALPLSFAQQRLWFLAQMEGGSEAYHIPLTLRLHGTLNRRALQRSLDRLVWRHEALRTYFVRAGETTVQRINRADIGFTLGDCDLSERGVHLVQALQQRLDDEANAPFDLATGPLIRGQVIRLDENDHMLAITMHHIVSDGWSLGVFVKELSVLYRAYSEGGDDPLAPLPVHYADYAAWQLNWLGSEGFARQSAYWQRALAGAPALLELPTDRPRPAQQSYAGATVPVVLDAALTRGLKSLSQRHGMTLYMTLLAAWSVVLARLSGQDEVVIGSPVANRNHAEVEGLIGYFGNMQALRVAVTGTLPELLAHVKGRALDAQANQEVPIEHILELIKPARNLSHTPIFQVILVWQNFDKGELDLPGLTLAQTHNDYNIAKFDQELELGEVGDGIEGAVSYATALFDRATITRQVGYLQRVLEAMVADEAQPIEQLDLLSVQERQQLLFGWNATQIDYRRDLCIHALFEAQAARTPDAIAVVGGKQTLTYRELNQQANQLAHHLRSLGVQPDDRVAICVERSLPMVVGIFAILKAGAGYVPLDPMYSGQRLAYIVKDSEPALLVLDAQTANKSELQQMAADIGVPLLNMQADAERWANESRDNPTSAEVAVATHHLAYVIYTSGSTGMPKGVMVEHAQAINLIQAHIDNCALTPHDAVLQFASFGFDASIEEIFSPLTAGARIVLRPLTMFAPDQHYLQLLRDERISVAELPTAFWQQWAQQEETASATDSAALRLVIVGGEKTEKRHLDRWRASAWGRHSGWLNTYGPTEATVYATSLLIDRHTELGTGEIPIGRPVANTHIYLLDTYQQPVPMGVAGELYIGGAGVARGYLNRPELTAERFIASPFIDGERLYKSGDLGRWLPDGTIEYLGRNDFQVKIRGFRIELGEIEARLAAHADVREAVVLAREDRPGEKRLVAYVTVAEGASISAEVLRTYLGGLLPEYMVPAAYVSLDAFPVTTNGKLDRKALPAPEVNAYVTRAYEAPIGTVEEALAQIWVEVLKIERVGRQDNFFELGGHSLLAVTMIERMRRADLQVDVRALFMSPTLAALAASTEEIQELLL